MQDVSSQKKAGPAARCPHESEYLGRNQDLQFVLCRPCGQVFLLQGGQRFAVPMVDAQNDATDAAEPAARASGE